MKKIIFFLFLLCTSMSFSQSVTGEDELYEEYKKVDKELNSVYNKLKNELKENDKKNLLEAQKAWMKFRDLNCKFKSQDPGDGGGPYENKMKIDCLIQSTIARTKELKNLIGGL
ncbi:MAG: lysozyme inhibitor LprI family protein [Flavobacterium sp.]|uniref:lysozyme inhibitor LprI family protein n=1 Tax=Flavobacterium sp. TaxID=239 RepID=UPI0027356D68|nr:lysozyme inhibitor LprI family protein [Flavobacterium sp.]MDP3681489.1 lysozyme inhibitor LprI family protein [Flavobacterium sp.]MDZ4330378.1 lysozyme inhibitor LprI family protein [Flavobacterium sp.]